MATVRAERRLAAIMAADIVGYSRLLEADEAGTLAAIRELRRAVIDPLLAEHHGRIVKLMGDGVLVEFGSVVDAVACAVATQKGIAARQAEIPPERRIVYRIGVNLVDLVVEGDDLLGDGVVVAARLEQLCDPGGVLISGTAYDHPAGQARSGPRPCRRAAGQEHQPPCPHLPRAARRDRPAPPPNLESHATTTGAGRGRRPAGADPGGQRLAVLAEGETSDDPRRHRRPAVR